MKNQLLNRLFFVIALGIISFFSYGSGITFEISGWVRKDDKAMRNAKVQVFQGLELVKETSSNRWGNFMLELDLDKEYLIVVNANNVQSKNIIIQTNSQMNAALEMDDYFFEFIVDLKEAQEEKSAFQLHVIVFDKEIKGFYYLEPSISEYLMHSKIDTHPSSQDELLKMLFTSK